MMDAARIQLRRDLAIGLASPGQSLVGIGFFVIILTLFALAMGPGRETLGALAVPAIWVAAMIAGLFGYTRIFAQDARCGWLDQIALSPLPLPVYVLCKACAHWLLSSAPLVLVSPAMALALHLDPGAVPALVTALVPGTLALTLLGVIGAALTQGAATSAGLMSVIVLPLGVPVLIFGVLASSSSPGASSLGAAAPGASPAHLMLLCALFAALLAATPMVAAAALGEVEAGDHE